MTNYDVIRVERKTAEFTVINSSVQKRAQNSEKTTSGDYYFGACTIVNFTTWFRLVGLLLRSSILDHIYHKDPTVIKDLKSIEPFFGDHLVKLPIFLISLYKIL